MVFSSCLFLMFFLPVCLIAHFAAPRAARNGVLLAMSLLFYAWGEVRFLPLMLASIVGNYAFALALDYTDSARKRKAMIIACVAANLGYLGYYKYCNFFLDNANSLLGYFGGSFIEFERIALPLGISFFTFQAMSYVIDVYRREVPAQRNPFKVGLYIALFPQLVAGPIVRYIDVAREIDQDRKIDVDGFAEGIRRFLIGLGKKVLIANLVAGPADAIFDIDKTGLSASIAWLGIVCYTLQIYFDFSGYSDMAIGLGKMFGFTFMENFNYPYSARSVTEFWRRWHISLSTWFRDYLYIPLGGNRGSAFATYRNLFIVFALCGLWHGAAWTFLIWGLVHGAFLVAERVGLKQLVERLPRAVQHLYLVFIVLLTWVPFRAADWTATRYYFKALFGVYGWTNVRNPIELFVGPGVLLAIVLGIIGSTPWLPYVREKLAAWSTSEGTQPAWKIGLATGWQLGGTASLLTILLASMVALSGNTYNPFIYFRF